MIVDIQTIRSDAFKIDDSTHLDSNGNNWQELLKLVAIAMNEKQSTPVLGTAAAEIVDLLDPMMDGDAETEITFFEDDYKYLHSIQL